MLPFPLYIGMIFADLQERGGSEVIALAVRKEARPRIPADPKNFSS